MAVHQPRVPDFESLKLKIWIWWFLSQCTNLESLFEQMKADTTRKMASILNVTDSAYYPCFRWLICALWRKHNWWPMTLPISLLHILALSYWVVRKSLFEGQCFEMSSVRSTRLWTSRCIWSRWQKSLRWCSICPKLKVEKHLKWRFMSSQN